MKIHSVLGVALVLASALGVSAGSAASAYAQGRPITVVTPQRSPIPSSPILPMANPVAPMSNPVAPIIPPPFVRYSGSTPQVVIPDSNRGGAPNRGGRGGGPGDGGGVDGRPGRGRGNVVVVSTPSYYGSYPYSSYSYDNYYPGSITPPPTIPGRLQGERYGDRIEDYAAQTSFNPNPNAPAPVPASTFVYEPQPVYYPEPRLIVREPQPNRVIQPPTAGTTRSDVILRLGEPWGSFTARGNETLYFEGGLVVVFGPDGRVSQVR